MSRIVIFLVCVLCIVAEDPVKIPPPFDPTQPIGPTTTPSPGPTTKSTPTTSSTPTTTKSTTPTSTTTTKPTTTTTKPTTTTSKPTTTTTKPTTPTPTPTPSPTPAPTPVGPAVINSFTGNYSNSSTICLMMKVQVQVELLDKDSTKLNVTSEVTSKSTCGTGNDTETLALYFGSNNLIFSFFKNNSKYELQSISATILAPATNKTETYYHKKAEFSVSEKQSYKCVKDQALNLTDINSTTTYAKLHVSQLQFEAFMNTTKAQYNSAWYCDATNTSDVVPVVVGCVLAVLVVLVLVAYLFGRRRCQARGYLSM